MTGRSTAVPAWVARRSWHRRNAFWVQRWLERKPRKAKADASEPETAWPVATILPFRARRTEPK